MHNQITPLLPIWLFIFFQYLLRVSDSVIIAPLQQTFQITPFQISLISASFYISYVIMQIPCGKTIDRYGLRPPLLCASFILTAACLLFSLAPTWQIAVLARCIMGMAAAFGTVSAITYITQYMKTPTPTFWIGFSLMIALLGATCGQAPWYWFVESVSHWRFAYLFAALFGLGVCFFTYVSVVPRRVPEREFEENLIGPVVKPQDDNPSSCGLTTGPIRKTEKKLDPTTTPHTLEKYPLLKHWRLLLYMFMINAPSSAFLALWGNAFYVVEHHLPLSQTTLYLSVAWIGNATGGALIGWFADHFQLHRKILYINGLLTALIMSWILLSPYHLAPIYSLIMLFALGFFSAANILVFTLIAKATSHHPQGRITGIVNTCNMGCAPVFQIIVGFLVTYVLQAYTHPYTLALSLIPIGLMSAMLILLTEEPLPHKISILTNTQGEIDVK